MSEGTMDAFQLELRLRKLRIDGQKILKGRELHDFLSIKERYDKDRENAERIYRSEYKMRTDVAYQMLLKKAGSLKQDLKPSFFGIDRFNTKNLNHEAQKLVRREHQRTMARLDAGELRESTAVLKQLSGRKQSIEHFRQAAAKPATQTRGPSPTPSD